MSGKKCKMYTRAYMFFVQSCIEDNKKQNKTDHKNVPKFTKLCAQMWKSKPEAEKKKFRIMEECDKKRYEVEKKIKRRETRHEKVRRAKKGKNALFFYEKSIRAEIQSLSPALRLKAAAERFRELSEEQRQPFLDLAAQDHQRYRREKKQISDEINKQKRKDLKKEKRKVGKKASKKRKQSSLVLAVLASTMVDILNSSLHQEQFPAEIDVYKIPHNRMKQLVSSITKALPEIQECLNYERQSLENILETMYTIVWELKTHEMIENTVIMKKLRERLLARQIHNQSVCNCHEDTDLLNIIDLVESVYSSTSDKERNFYWLKLQESLYEFLEEFVPHMEEEENTFQPLLNQYFDYEELRQLKETVITKHEEWKEKLSSEKSLKRFKRDSESLDCVVEVKKRKEESQSDSLPEELLFKIFGYLCDPRDLGRAGRVSRRWREVSRASQLWRHLPLSQWQRNIWAWDTRDLYETIQEERKHPERVLEEDSPFFESFLPLLDEIGHNVKQLSLSGSSSLTNSNLQEMLKRTTNIQELDCSYTNITSPSFNSPDLGLAHLVRLDLSGCANVSDDCIRILADKIPCKSARLKWLSLSGCELLTEISLGHLKKFSSTLEHIDLSGCFRMSGSSIKVFTNQCKNLNLETLSYCSYIQDGPAPDISSGCQNLDCDMRYCCSNYQN